MSRFFTIKTNFFIFLVLISGVGLFQTPIGEKILGSKVSSTPPPFQQRLGKVFRKMTSPVKITVTASTNSPQTNVPYQLTAQIESPLISKNLLLSWKLPPGLQIVKGSTDKEISELSPGEIQSHSITVLQTNSENQQVHVSLESLTQKTTTVTQYNTVSEEKIQKSSQRLYQRNLKYMRKNKKYSP